LIIKNTKGGDRLSKIVGELTEEVEKAEQEAREEAEETQEAISVFTREDEEFVISELSYIARTLLKNRKDVTVRQVRMFVGDRCFSNNTLLRLA
jgi:CRISPR/Cas system-associated exonuclease Cas4 (RecB family)